MVLIRNGRADEAEPLILRAIQICEAVVGPDHWRTARARSALGQALSLQARYEEAEPHLIDSFSILSAERGNDHALTQLALERIVSHYNTVGDAANAGRYRFLLKSD